MGQGRYWQLWWLRCCFCGQRSACWGHFVKARAMLHWVGKGASGLISSTENRNRRQPSQALASCHIWRATQSLPETSPCVQPFKHPQLNIAPPESSNLHSKILQISILRLMMWYSHVYKHNLLCVFSPDNPPPVDLFHNYKLWADIERKGEFPHGVQPSGKRRARDQRRTASEDTETASG